jgi:hypothetical protein
MHQVRRNARRRIVAQLAAIALITGAIGAVVIVLLLRDSKADDPPAVVPRAHELIKIDGQWNDPDWNGNSLKFAFRGLNGDDAAEARPYSEVRFIHDDAKLYVGLYASDIDILSSDAFDLRVGAVSVHITATGKITPDSPDIKVGVDRDGTLDDQSNHDEEWKLEIAIPLARIGGEGAPIDARAARCDLPKGQKRCGEWTGQLTMQ